jgi:TonB-linked SusC/RagA family outer membrane protein
MKKNLNEGVRHYSFIKKLLMKIKIGILLILVGVSSVFADPIYSQITRISLDADNARLESVLDEIESKSEFYFIFNQKQIDVNRVVKVESENDLIDKILSDIFSGTNVNFEINDRIILLTTESLKDGILKKPLSIELQQQSITGIVTDAQSGDPLPGVNVLVKGTIVGVLTDVNGQFSLVVPDPRSTLVFSFVGYIAQEVRLTGQRVININLAQSVEALDEVVVIGYGTVKKKDLTGSVVSMPASQISELSATRVEQALLGKVAGVQVKAVSGEPGVAPQVRIRGVGSISAGVDPLYVVDGFPIDNLQALNPNDIESIDILKDASATAIYGSRGSNGVVIVTTKRGKAGKANITFDTYYGFQVVEKLPEMKNSIDQANWFFDGMKNKNLDAGNDVSGDPLTWKQPVPQIIMDILNSTNTADENALEYIFRTAPQQQYQVTASGGNENVQYLLSAEYLNQDGIVIESNFERYSFRSNIDAQLTENLKIKANINPSFTKTVSLPVTGEGCCLGSNIVAAALQIHNFYPPINPDGSYFNYDGLTALAAVYNPVAVAELTQTLQNRSRLIGNVNLEYSILPALKFNVMVGGSIYAGKGMRFRPLTPIFFNEPATGRDEASLTYNWLTEYTLNYVKSFGLHNLSGLAGFTVQKDKGYSNVIESNLYPNNLVSTLNAASGITLGSSNISAWSLISYLARINYNYNEKYYLTTSVRRDGSSRFGLQQRYAVFPSVALAWRMSNENFLKDVPYLSMLKLRVSYGESGNNDIGNYQQYATIAYQIYPFGESAVGGFVPNQIANPILTWEKQKQFNVGIDAGFLEGRINMNADHFRSVNSDLLLNVNIPGITGFTTALQNIGEVQNSGWEFVLNTRNLVGKFEWETDFNISTYENKVVKLGPAGDPIYSGNNVTRIGEPIGMFYGYMTDGVFMNAAELAQGPIYNPGKADRSRVGDIRFKDISGPDGVPDGVIDNNDNTIMGNPYPDFFFGMTNRFRYNNLSLSVSLQGSQGNDVLCVTRDAGFSGRSRVHGYAYSNNYWKSEAEPGDGKTPRPNDTPTGGQRRPSQHWIDDGSFVRVTNMTLSYVLPDKISNKIMLSDLRLYTTATNPFLFTKYISFNPDVSFRGNPLRPGNEANDYPLGKGIIFGLTASF